MHHEAEILVIARMVEANLHIKELKPWLNGTYIAATIITFITVAYLGMSFLGLTTLGIYIQGVMVATSCALWLKHSMLQYQMRYYQKDFDRSRHAKEALRRHAHVMHNKKRA